MNKIPFQDAADFADQIILEKMIEIAKNKNMGDKYQALGSNIFGFEIFEDIFKVINERGFNNDEQMFKAGVASAEAAVRRLREEYYEEIIKDYVQEEK
jgi:uncharacterized protein (UPF0297 family)